MTDEQIYEEFHQQLSHCDRDELATLDELLYYDNRFSAECPIEFRRAVYRARVEQMDGHWVSA